VDEERRSLNKRVRDLPENVQNILIALKKDMEANGPIRGDWPNFKALAGARYREGLTQKQLSEITGIPQRHISEMENGKRPIGKEMAKRMGKVLKISYNVLL
jgi:hypothetical protein